MKLYQAIFLSLLGHGIVFLPMAEQSPPDISIAPMQVTLNSTAPKTTAGNRKQTRADSRPEPEAEPRTDDVPQHSVADRKHFFNERIQTSKADVEQHKTVSVQTDEISKPVDDRPFVPATFAVRDALSQQRAQTYVISRLNQALENYFEYPLLARRNGWEGRVVLALDVYLDGRIHNIQLKSGSGHRLLDRSALKAVSRIRSLPDVPRWRGNSPLNIDIPVIYRLQG